MTETATRSISVALAGNPNSGKTTLFNNICGTRQKVANYPGVTVEKVEGKARHRGFDLKCVDLPGTYSLTAYSIEELIARNSILETRPDVVVGVIDCSNLDRNLSFALQLMELDAPLVLAFNFSDEAEEKGYVIDFEQLSRLLGVPVVPTVATRGKGTGELLDRVVEVANDDRVGRARRVNYGKAIEDSISRIQDLMVRTGSVPDKYPSRWVALKLLEKDRELEKLLTNGSTPVNAVLEQVEAERDEIQRRTEMDVELAISDGRYGFVQGALAEAVREQSERVRRTRTEMIDSVLLNRVLGLPIFLGLMWIVFQLTFTIGGPPMDWIDVGFGWLGNTISGTLPESWFRSLLVDGIISGVGGIVIFLPNILLLFFAIGLMEATGYMARVAFLMDKAMHRVGLHGKSFIPLLIGFGCAIPAIMATRTLENRRDRLATMMVVPFMSCGAKLVVYVLFAGVFFEGARTQGNVIFSLYLIGVLMAVITAFILRKTLLSGESEPFVMELPPYRVPTIRFVLVQMWHRGFLFLKKAGTVILAISIFVWLLSTFPHDSKVAEEFDARISEAERRYETVAAGLGMSADALREDPEFKAALEILISSDDGSMEVTPTSGPVFEAAKEYQRIEADVMDLEGGKGKALIERTLIGRLGHFLVPAFEPMGLGDWKVSVAFFTGFLAKEVVVSTLGTLYAVDGADGESPLLRERLRKDPVFTPLTAYVLMLFVVIYAPCMSTFAIVRRESNSWGWAALQAMGATAVAWVVAVSVYQVGHLFIQGG